MSKRLEILENSLAKKQKLRDSMIQNHFETVREANGQPLNDKKNGNATLSKWERQNDSIRRIHESIEKTKYAIEKEESKIAQCESFEIPEILKPYIKSGKIKQWRKHPRFFFVDGVERARLFVNEKGIILHRYASEIKDKDQFDVFKNIFNEINQKQKQKVKA